MTRGRIIPLTRPEIAARALSAVGTNVHYKLAHGGTDPARPTPGDADRLCDCSGFVAWCLGVDRLQASFPFSGGYLSTRGMWDEASGPAQWFQFVVTPEPGDIVVYPTRSVLGVRSIGHCGVVVAAPTSADPWTARVVDCSAGQDRRVGHAITERSDASVWRKRGKFLRFARTN